LKASLAAVREYLKIKKQSQFLGMILPSHPIAQTKGG
jgi:hypothetical protein